MHDHVMMCVLLKGARLTLTSKGVSAFAVLLPGNL